MKSIGVVGAGVMGQGVAQDLAQSGMEVWLVDLTDDLLAASRSKIQDSLRLQRLFKPKRPIEGVLELIHFTTRIDDLRSVDYVVENVVERWPDKERVWRDLDRLCRPECILAANTSAIPIARFGAATRRPDRVVGIHFMNPVPMKSSVEVIRSLDTSDQTIDTTVALLTRMGKQSILVKDSPGFVSNRVLMLTINEAFELLRDGVCDAEGVDRVFRECFGHPMGPLATADLIGLDTILLSIEVLREEFGSAKFTPSPALRRLVDAGRLGRKTGRGVFEYPQA